MNLAAVMVETRDYPDINEIIKRHLDKLPKYTKLYFFGSKQNNKRITYPHKFKEVQIKTGLDYCYLVTKVDFWEQIEEENILIFQRDSGIIGSNIEDFYEYDYIGSPLKGEPLFVYNGGLSFRHRSVMIDICKKFTYKNPEEGHEDGFFSHRVEEHYKKTPREVAERFSVENIFRLGTFGFHQIETSLTPEQVEQIKSQKYE